MRVSTTWIICRCVVWVRVHGVWCGAYVFVSVSLAPVDFIVVTYHVFRAFSIGKCAHDLWGGEKKAKSEHTTIGITKCSTTGSNEMVARYGTSAAAPIYSSRHFSLGMTFRRTQRLRSLIHMKVIREQACSYELLREDLTTFSQSLFFFCSFSVAAFFQRENLFFKQAGMCLCGHPESLARMYKKRGRDEPRLVGKQHRP